MNILVASDSFKGSLSSKTIFEIIKEAWADKDHHIQGVIISDGGECFLDSMKQAIKGEMMQALSYEPAGNMIEAHYLLDNKVAYIELDSIAGMSVTQERNPLKNSTYGLGLALKDAISRGAKKIILGIGGSATNDGGAGMLQAMGCDFYNENDLIMTEHMNGEMIGHISKLDTWRIDQLMSGVEVVVASDVTNPLLGPQGATHTYAKQKGASAKDIDILEKNMAHYSDILVAHQRKDLSEKEGSGAAGGVGFGALMMLNATITSGISYLMKQIHLEDKMNDSDIIIVGEGKLDQQSEFGKAPLVIAKMAKSLGKKVIGIFGSSEIDKHESIDQIYSLVPTYATHEQAMNDAGGYLKKMLKEINI